MKKPGNKSEYLDTRSPGIQKQEDNEAEYLGSRRQGIKKPRNRMMRW